MTDVANDALTEHWSLSVYPYQIQPLESERTKPIKLMLQSQLFDPAYAGEFGGAERQFY